MLPWILGFALLTVLPAIACLMLSMTRTTPLRRPVDGPAIMKPTWIALDHYRTALAVDSEFEPSANDPWYWALLGGKPNDVRFYKSLYNSLTYSVFAVPLGLVSSLFVALLLSRPYRGTSLVRALVYLPHLLGGVATLVIWSWLLNPQFGWVNQLIRLIYRLLDPMVRIVLENGTADWPVPGWLHSPSWCKPAVVLIHVWTMGGSMLIFLAALKSVPSTLYDAAGLDGAGSWQRFRHVTLPQITPAILFNGTVSLIFAMQSFNESYLLENRAQRDGLLFYVLNLYRVAFEPPYRFGYACAQAMILWVVLLLLTLPLLFSARRWVYYAGQR